MADKDGEVIEKDAEIPENVPVEVAHLETPPSPLPGKGPQNLDTAPHDDGDELATNPDALPPPNPPAPPPVSLDGPPPALNVNPPPAATAATTPFLPPQPEGVLAGSTVAADQLYRRPGRVMTKVAKEFEKQVAQDTKTAARVAKAGKTAEQAKIISDKAKSVVDSTAKVAEDSEALQKLAVESGSKNIAKDFAKGDKNIKKGVTNYEKGAAKAEKRSVGTAAKAEKITTKANKEFEGSEATYEKLLKRTERSGAKPGEIDQIKYVIKESSNEVKGIKGKVLTDSSRFSGDMEAASTMVKDGVKASKAFGAFSKVARGVEVVGVGLAVYEVYDATKTGDKKQIAAATGDAAGGLIGGFLAGAATGAVIGAVGGAGIGAVPGYIIGGAVGVGGALIGSWIGRKTATATYGAPDLSPEIQAENLQKAQTAVAKYKLPGGLNELYYLDDQARKKGFDSFPDMYEATAKNSKSLPAPDQIARNMGYKDPVTVTPPSQTQMAAQLSGSHIITGTTITLSPDLLARQGTNDNRQTQIHVVTNSPPPSVASVTLTSPSGIQWSEAAPLQTVSENSAVIALNSKGAAVSELQAKILLLDKDANLGSKNKNAEGQLPDDHFGTHSLAALNKIRASYNLPAVNAVTGDVLAQLDQQIASLSTPKSALAPVVADAMQKLEARPGPIPTELSSALSAGVSGNAYRDTMPSRVPDVASTSASLMGKNFGPNRASLRDMYSGAISSDPPKSPEPILTAGPDKQPPVASKTNRNLFKNGVSV